MASHCEPDIKEDHYATLVCKLRSGINSEDSEEDMYDLVDLLLDCLQAVRKSDVAVDEDGYDTQSLQAMAVSMAKVVTVIHRIAGVSVRLSN